MSLNSCMTMTNQVLCFHCGPNKRFHIEVWNILSKALEMLCKMIQYSRRQWWVTVLFKNSDCREFSRKCRKYLTEKSHYHLYDTVSIICQGLGKVDYKIKKSLKAIRFNSLLLQANIWHNPIYNLIQVHFNIGYVFCSYHSLWRLVLKNRISQMVGFFSNFQVKFIHI